MRHRLLAVVGFLAYGTRQFIGSLLGLVGLRALARFVVPGLIVALAAGAVLSARDTAAILAGRPEVTRSTLTEVAAYDGEDGSVWFGFDALLDDSHLSTPADLGTFFYLARDPTDPDAGLLVRSGLNDAFIRQRVLAAMLIDDPDLVAQVIEAFGPLPTNFTVDTSRFLDELEAGGEPDEAFTPSDLEDEPSGTNVLVTGRVVEPIRLSTCASQTGCADEGASWYYLFADPSGAAALVLRSPHPPDAMPVRIEGLFLRDSFDLGPVLESDWYAAIDTQVPINRALAAGSRPPILVQASWVPALVFGFLAGLLLVSQLTGYPVFASSARPAPRRSMGVGEGVDVQITGRLARDGAMLDLDRSPGAVERISIAELALRMWRYGLLPRDQSRREAERSFIEQAAGDGDRLVIHERDQSALIIVERDSRGVEVETGRLYRVIGSMPAIRFRQASSRAYLATRNETARDGAGAEIAAEASGRQRLRGHVAGVLASAPSTEDEANGAVPERRTDKWRSR